MENIKYTTKYIKAIKIALIAVAFTIVSPIFALAQYDSGGTYPDVGYTYSDTGGTYGTYPDVGYTYSDTGGTYNIYPDIGYTYSDTGGTYSTYPDVGYTYSDIGGNYPAVGAYTNVTYPDVGGTYADIGGTYTDIGGTYPAVGTNYPNISETPWMGGSPGYGYGGNWGYGWGNRFVSSGGYTGSGSTFTLGTFPVSGSNQVSSGGYDGSNGSFAYYPTQNYPIYYGSGGYGGVNLNSQFVPNQVLAYTDTNPSLDSVYLSDIPATGFSDYYEILIFISLLVSWSAILAYVFLKKKIESQTIPAVAHANKTEVSNTDSFVTSNLLNKINSDNSEINMVEEYARTNKVLLSSDASIKIVKLSRLGQINASEYIRSIARGEWIAIGANQIV